jgi:two-component sensor histidine kinase
MDIAVGMRLEDLYPSETEIVFWRNLYERAKTEGAYSIEHCAFADSSIFHLNINLLERDKNLFGLSIFAKDITERKKAEDQIQRSLLEKETLLRELYHRTKNNMNVIISMLKLQSREIEDARLKEAFSETEDRIISMSLVHEKLYEAQDLSHINLKEYFEDLTRQIMANYNLSNKLPSLSLYMDDVYVLIDTAIACGLIVNELISNTLKYAFPSGQAGEIAIRLRQEDNNEISLIVSDNGIGLPSGFDVKRDGHLGLRLIESLARGKIRAKVVFNTDHGLSCQLRFTNN